MQNRYRTDEEILSFLSSLESSISLTKNIVTCDEVNKPDNYKRLKPIIFNILFYLFIVVLLTTSIFFAVSNNPQKSIFGYRFYNIETGSMNPGTYSKEHNFTDGFKAGDMIIVKLCESSEIKKDDIITFMPGDNPDVYLTHRVVEIKNNLNGQAGTFFITRGDASNANDPPISGKMLIGKKIMTIPRIGSSIKYIKEHLVLSLIMILASFLLILVIRLYFKKPEKLSAS